MIGGRKRGTYGGAICRRNEQKSLPDIYFVLAFLRLDVPPIDRSSFGSLKTSQEILQEITPNTQKKKKALTRDSLICGFLIETRSSYVIIENNYHFLNLVDHDDYAHHFFSFFFCSSHYIDFFHTSDNLFRNIKYRRNTDAKNTMIEFLILRT